MSTNGSLNEGITLPSADQLKVGADALPAAPELVSINQLRAEVVATLGSHMQVASSYAIGAYGFSRTHYRAQVERYDEETVRDIHAALRTIGGGIVQPQE